MGHWALGIGHGAWGMGYGALGKTVPSSQLRVLSKEMRLLTQQGLNPSYPVTALLKEMGHGKNSLLTTPNS
jgi:hypothetical protein